MPHLIEAAGHCGAQVLEDGRVDILDRCAPIAAGAHVTVLQKEISQC